MIKFKKKKLIVIILVILAITISSSFILCNVGAKGQNDKDELFNSLEPFFEALTLIRDEYIEKDIDLDVVVQEAIKGMLTALDDPYTRYMDPQSLQREQEDMFLGYFGGLGIIISVKDDQLIIISPIEDTPAYRANIKAGDIIVEINGESTKGITVDEAVNLLRGEKGTEVTIGVKRENVDDLIDFTIVRDIIEVKAVKSEVMGIDHDLGYVRITTFNANTDKELEESLNTFANNKGIRGIILDLRNNPGGLLESAIDVSSKFIKKGPIVHINDRNGKIATFKSRGNQFPEWPLYVLINEGSASASEIVAGAVQDSGRGKLLGKKTFGKGVVQQVFELLDDSGIVMTTSEYFTPSERSIHNIGIEPDILIEIGEDPEQDMQLNKAIQLMIEEIN